MAQGMESFPREKEEEPNSSEAEQTEAEQPVYKKGEQVLVERSSGEIEGGWTIEGFEQANEDEPVHAKLSKQDPEDPQKVLEKSIPKDELYETNAREKTFAQWHNIWRKAGGGVESVDSRYQADEKITAEQAWEILGKGRRELGAEGPTPREIFELYFKNDK